MAGYTSYYECPICGHKWQDEWSCACNEECPECGASDIEPVDFTTDEDDTIDRFLGIKI